MRTTIDDRVAELERANGELRRQLDACGAELKEARDQQTATTEVLQVINSSPGDLAPVFQAMLEKATDLCEAQTGVLWTYHGAEMQPAAILGAAPGYEEYLRQGLRPLSPNHAHLSRGPALVHIPDIPADPVYAASELARALVELGGIRTILMVPMRKDSTTLGAFCIYRKEPRPFTDKQIALLQNFAAQAVIAMENARLLGETREALEQQTATAEVLQVINASPVDLAPVFDAVLDKATRFCDAAFGTLWTYDGERFHAVALRQVPKAYAAFLSQAPLRPVPFSGLGRVAAGESVAHFVDVAADEAYGGGDPALRALLELGKARSTVAVPLRKDNTVLGAITAYRNEVRPFSDKQIALLQNFAAQAVIAMENARLLTETREALEQQTATAEVLQVINSSPGDLVPVFDAMLDKAVRLCDFAFAALWTYDGTAFHPVALHGMPAAFEAYLREHTPPAFELLHDSAGPIHFPDVMATEMPQRDPEFARVTQQLATVRTLLLVPLRKDAGLLGAFVAYREEVRPFSDKQISLLQNFAAQAVIAMENARLLTETREALEQQTATAEVLQVINSSPGDLAPVFDAILDKAQRVCGVDHAALELYDGERFHAVAVHGASDRFAETLRHGYRAADSPAGRALLGGGRFVQIADAAQIDHVAFRTAAEVDGIRTVLFIPLRRDDALLGMIASARREVRPFSEKEIALLENFAAQAVIAMENARLLTETREALEQQTATAEVLQVINASPGDLVPVFDAMLEKAMRLCRIALGALELHENGKFRAVAVRGVSGPLAELLRQPFEPPPESPLARLIAGEKVVQITDMSELARLRPDDPRAQAGAQYGLHTALFVPLRKDAELLGQVVAFRQELRPFSEKEIALLQNFAAQAVIAMENARLLGELQARTRDLEESLEYQTATSDVLKVISRSTFDLQPILDILVETGQRLCDSDTAALAIREGDVFRYVATRSFDPAYDAVLRGQTFASNRETVAGRVRLTGEVVHVPDIAADPDLRLPEAVTLGKLRTMLGVPLLRDGLVVGALTLSRQRIAPYTERQIELVRTFADQAVIAMENARLLGELQARTRDLEESLEYQTATSDVLKVISRSTFDLQPVLDTLTETAARLCDADGSGIAMREGEVYQYVALHATYGISEYLTFMRQRTFAPGRDPTIGRVALEGKVVHIADIAADPEYALAQSYSVGRIRTNLGVPLLRDGAVIGMLTVFRQRVELFSERQIELLRTFADQAVIAIENARLLTETREALEQQTATAEVLQVINSSPGDLAPVFDAMLEKAHSLCGATIGALEIWDGERLRALATRGLPAPFEELISQGYRPDPTDAHWQLVDGAGFVQIPDQAAVDDPMHRRAAELTGVRTFLAVALRKDNTLLGRIVAGRPEVRPFTDKQIALLRNFAAQAVIAMENARLLTETREALEQQTATAEVLQVINSSPGDLAPVFDAMLDKATRLCDGVNGILWTFEGKQARLAASRNMLPVAVELLRQQGESGNHPMVQRVIAGDYLFQFDLAENEAYRSGEIAAATAAVIASGVRTVIWVALVKDVTAVGAFVISRQEVRPFTDKQIALLQNFAAQAVVAMENARLLTETREALEQQTATAEVLGVINSSPGDLAPVFDAMLEKAMRLCEAAFGMLMTFDGERFQVAAHRGLPVRFIEYMAATPSQPGPSGGQARVLRGEDIVHFADMKDDEAYRDGTNPNHRAMVDLGGARTGLVVPLRKEEAVVGTFTIYRQQVRPFTAKQIALLQNFAAQAVIATENARLLNELRRRTSDLQESLDYQTATSDVLRVVSRSTFDLDTVLQTVVTTAVRLCRADSATIHRVEDGEYRWAAGHMLSPEYERIERNVRILPGIGTLVGRAVLEGATVQILDAWTDPFYEAKEDARVGGVHTMIGVPLLRDGAPIGVIGLARRRVEAFSEREVQLVTTFADQAVIAIENARLIGELRTRTAELGRSVDELRLLSEVGQAVSSTLDLRAVLSTVLGRSVGLTGADAGAVFRYSRAERSFRLVEAFGWDEALLRSVGDLHVPEAETAMGEAAARRAPIQLADLADRPRAALRDASLAAGFRGVLIVPLVGPERILGALVLQRRAAGEFPAETVRLMQTLASQSVLAIQNARLFREIADKSEQLALASEHKSQFLANMSHELRTPLNAILGYAELLVDGIYGALPEKAQGVLERVQNNGKHLLALINDVLDLAKIEAGQLTLTLEDYVLSDVVRSVVTATEPLAAAKGLKFAATVEDGVPRAYGDARRVSQVLLNLVGNAIKFTDAGEIEIRAAAVDGQFVLTVRDTGPGIADADQERIFGEFQQIENTDTRKKGGTGLGLAISKRMVEMQGGMISVDSAPGRGSTFRVVLPVRVEPALEEAAE